MYTFSHFLIHLEGGRYMVNNTFLKTTFVLRRQKTLQSRFTMYYLDSISATPVFITIALNDSKILSIHYPVPKLIKNKPTQCNDQSSLFSTSRA